jgi:hypothetical protein
MSSPECRIKYNINDANRTSENLAKVRDLETRVKNQNTVHEEIKNRFCSRIACYHSVWSSRMLSINTKIKMYKSVILPVIFCDLKLGLSHYRKNIDGVGGLRAGSCGEYLDL